MSINSARLKTWLEEGTPRGGSYRFIEHFSFFLQLLRFLNEFESVLTHYVSKHYFTLEATSIGSQNQIWDKFE